MKHDGGIQSFVGFVNEFLNVILSFMVELSNSQCSHECLHITVYQTSPFFIQIKIVFRNSNILD